MTSVSQSRAAAPARRIALPVKVAYSAFVAVLVPCYWAWYTPWNFLYFCDVAVLITLVGLWREHPLLISSQAVAILLPQALWVVDFGARLVAGVHVTGMTAYMFNDELHWFVRALSSFHGWLPFFLIWLITRVGYDRRALLTQSAMAVVVLLVSFYLAPPPPPPADNPTAAVNINYVYGLDDRRAQTFMAPHAWLAGLTGLMLALYGMTHLLLRRVFLPRNDLRVASLRC